jgi:hypothetical protein
MDKTFVLGHRVPEENGEVLFQGFTHDALGVFDCSPVAEAARHSTVVAKVAFVFRFFFDYDLK